MDFVHQVSEINEVVKGRRVLALSVLPSGSLCLEFDGGVRLTCELHITDGETTQCFEVDIPDPSEADRLHAVSGQASDREVPPDR